MDLAWQRIRQDLPTFILLAILLVLASVSIIVAEWTDGLRGLTTVGLVGLLAGYVLARSQFVELTALITTTIYGMFVVGLQQTLHLGGGFLTRDSALELLDRSVEWLSAAANGGFNQDDVMFVVVLGILFWYLGHNAAWNLFRGGRLWRSVVPPGIVLLVNLSYYTGDARLGALLPAYLFVALLLAVQTNILAREGLWRSWQMSFTPGIRFDLIRAGVLASVVLLALAWLVPTASADERLSDAWKEQVNPYLNLRETWDRLFSLEGRTENAPADYYGGQTLTLSGSVNLGNKPVMDVQAPPGPRYYWRSKVFDTFDGRTWTTTNDSSLRSEFGVLYFEDAGYELRRNVRQRFEMHVPASRLVYSAAQPMSVSLPVSFDVLYIDRGQERGSLTELRSQSLLGKGDTYEAISSITYADQASLRAAGTNYPGWVLNNYLQVPDTATPRTREMAAQLTAPYDNPYDKAKALESWLRTSIVYDESISAPPPDVDAIDWVLFEQQRGYCNYYASAMTVMLRTQGVPARIATGFAQGEYNARRGSFRVVEGDAHSWVEVYFPGYGWVEFEPTASQPPIPAYADEGLAPGGTVGLPGEQVESPPEDVAATQPNPDQDGGVGGSFGAFGPVGRAGLRVPVAALLFGGLFVIAISVGGFLGWREARKRGLRGLSAVSRAYATLNVLAPWLGVRSNPSDTPSERAAALTARMPESAVPLHEIAAYYGRERFSPGELPPDSVRKAGRAWQSLRPALRRRIVKYLLRLRTPE